MEAPGGDRHRQEELVIMGCEEQQHNNNNIIIKGKRTKRLRPQSPIPFAIPTSSSSPENGGVDGGSTTCSAELFQDSATEEEEDMANCLILLAQGQSRAAHNDYNHTSKRFLEAATAGATAGKAAVAAAAGGYYVYECKTCNRTFPSFQALGGHRASHKKPKANIIGDDHKNKHFGIGLLASDEDHHHQDTQLFKNNITSNNPSPLSLHLSNRGLVLSSSNKSSNKVHECSICGAEFTSGQALGGHMRRHRTPIGANTTLSLMGPSAPPFEPQQQQQLQQQQQQQNQIKKQKNMLSLDLDLNLPAPSEDDHQKDQPKFLFASNQQPQAPPQPQPQQQQERLRILVDCHY